MNLGDGLRSGCNGRGGLDTFLFRGSLAVSLAVAGVAAFPVNRWLIARGRGHSVVHALHGDHGSA